MKVKKILILACVTMTGCIGNNIQPLLQTGPAAQAHLRQDVQQDIPIRVNSQELVRSAPMTSVPVQRERLDNGRCNPYFPFDDFIKCDLEQAKVDAAKERASNE